MANVTISSFPAQTSMTDATIIPTVYSNLNYQISGANLLPYFQANIPGGNIAGDVANATYANTAGVAYSVAGANVTGTVANATFALNAGNSANANTANYATNAGTAGSVAGTNVVGEVSFATVANSVAAANVVGVVANAANANLANSATIANVANLAYSVDGANVTGPVANAVYADTSGSATTAGTVTTAAQPNITSVGTLTSLTANGNVTGAYFIGDGSQLTNLPSNSTLANGTSNVSIPVIDGNVNVTVNGVTPLVATQTGITVSGNIDLMGGDIVQASNNNLTISVDDPTNDGYYLYTAVNDNGVPVTQTSVGYDSFTVSTDVQGAVKTWNFDASGNLTAPGNVGGLTGANISVYAVDDGSTGSAELKSVSYAGYALGSNIRATQQNATISTSNAAYTWTFDNTGNLTVPGNIFAGNIASPAPVLSGFSFIGDGGQLTNVSIANGTSSISIPAVNGNVNITSNGITALTVDDLGLDVHGYVAATGNITGDYFIGNGALLTGIPAGYTDANVEALLSSGTVSNNIVTTGNVSGAYILGNGSQLTGLPGGYTDTDVEVLLESGTLTTNIITSANVQAGYFIGNGSQLTGLPDAYGNANVAAYLPTYTGNITANHIAATTFSAGTNNVQIGNNTIGTANANLVIDPQMDGSPLTGNLIVLGNLTVGGNLTYVDVSSATTSNLLWIAANGANAPIFASGGGLAVGPLGAYATFTFGETNNVWESSLGITASGNVTSPFFFGDGYGLSNIVGANVTGTVGNATNSNVAITVSANAQPNITSVGTLTSLTALGNITTAGYFIGQALTNANSAVVVNASNVSLGVAGNTAAVFTASETVFNVRNDISSAVVNRILNYNTGTREITYSQAMGAFSGVLATFSGQLTNGNMGTWVQAQGNVTLPQDGTVPLGAIIYISNQTLYSQPVVVSVYNTSTGFIYNPPQYGNGTRTIQLYQGQWGIFMSRGTNEWDIIASNLQEASKLGVGPQTAWGTSVTMDNLNVEMQTDGYLYMSAVTGSITIKGSTLGLTFGNPPSNDSIQSTTLTAGTWTKVTNTHPQSSTGDTFVSYMQDVTNNRIYRVTSIKNLSGPNQGSITIERILG